MEMFGLCKISKGALYHYLFKKAIQAREGTRLSRDEIRHMIDDIRMFVDQSYPLVLLFSFS